MIENLKRINLILKLRTLGVTNHQVLSIIEKIPNVIENEEKLHESNLLDLSSLVHVIKASEPDYTYVSLWLSLWLCFMLYMFKNSAWLTLVNYQMKLFPSKKTA